VSGGWPPRRLMPNLGTVTETGCHDISRISIEASFEGGLI